jgi:hypothetical protein
LILAIIQVVIIWKYDAFIPLCYCGLFVEALLRFIAGKMKPLEIKKPPPGAIMTHVFLVLIPVLILLSV